MARHGPPQKEQRVGHSANGDWILIPSAPFEAPESRNLPGTLIGVPVLPETLGWWNTLKAMPHCVLWCDSDWVYALNTAILMQSFYATPTSGLATEIRRREDNMGTTVEARRKLGIRYVGADVIVPVSSKEANSVPNLDDRRVRLVDAS